MADNENVRAALAEFTEVTGWFTADTNTEDHFAQIKLTATQVRVLTAAMRLRNAIQEAANG